MLDRTRAPQFRGIEHFNIQKAESFLLDNQLPLHVLKAGEHEILRFEIVLKSGKWFENRNGLAHFTTRMLLEGTEKRNAAAISEFFDYYGAQIQMNSGQDYNSVTLYCLNKHFEKLLPVVLECLFHPVFPDYELTILKDIQVQQIRINNEKNNYLAGKFFREQVFGKDHPYGESLEMEDVNRGIDRAGLLEFHQKRMMNEPEFFLTGHVTEEHKKLVNQLFHNFPAVNRLPAEFKTVNEKAGTELVIHKEGSFQSSVRIGRRIMGKNHPDHFVLVILAEVLGGYFGSRLMKNIREDKGYTYGIHTSLVHLIHDAYMVTGADVMKDHTRDSIHEIEKEMEKLRQEKIGEKELTTVRNYMLGNFLSGLETSFSLADKFKYLHFSGLDYDYYTRFIDAIKFTTAEEIRTAAQKYLDKKDYLVVIVGADN